MTFHTRLRIFPLFAVLALMPLRVAGQETLFLQSGREVPLRRDGRLEDAYAKMLLREAGTFLNQGRLDFARDNCQALLAKGDETVKRAVTALLERIEEVETSSLIILKNGQTFKGKLRVSLRSDHLGIGERRSIPLWKIRQIAAEYFIDYSLVTKTYYVVTVLEVQLRNAPLAKSRLTEEVTIEVEQEDGTVRSAIIGYPYVLLRKHQMGDAFPQMIRDRVSKIVVYPALYEGDLSQVEAKR